MVLKKITLVFSLLLAVLFVFVLSGVQSVDAGRGDGDGGSQESEVTPTPTLVGEEESPVDSGHNLLANPDFAGGFSGWSSVNGHWVIHTTQCDASIWPQEMAEMDQDRAKSGEPQDWLVGQEDWLWQDVAAPVEHSALSFTIYESHHMSTGIAETRLYGSDDGVTWTEVWYRPAPEAEAYGAGKQCEPVPEFTYTIPVTHSYAYYRLEFHGKMVDEFDGWIFSWLSLEVVPAAETATPEVTATQLTPKLTPTPTEEMDRPNESDEAPATPVPSSTPLPSSTATSAPTSTPPVEATACADCDGPDTATPEATATSGRGDEAAATPGPTPTAKVRGG